jgi:hypothetical protein
VEELSMTTALALPLIVQRPQVQPAPNVANKPPQPPELLKNGEQFATRASGNAGKSTPGSLPEGGISRHNAAGGGE